MATQIVVAATCSGCTIQTFRIGDVSCLLGPVSLTTLQHTIRHYHIQDKNISPSMLLGMVHDPHRCGRHCIIHFGSQVIPIRAASVTCFCSRRGGACLIAGSGGHCVVSRSLSILSSRLSPKQFFHVSHDYVVTVSTVIGVIGCLNGQLGVATHPHPRFRVIIDQSQISSFLG